MGRTRTTTSQPRKPGGARQKERLEQILRKAAERFATQGYDATTIRDIADDVSILPGSLYYYFDTKEDLLKMVVADAAAFIKDRSWEIANSDKSPKARLVEMIEFQLEEMIRNHDVHAILNNERVRLRSTAQFAEIVVHKREAYEAWRKVLNEGREEGVFDSSLDLYHTIRTIVRTLNTAADWYTRGDDQAESKPSMYDLKEVREFYVRFITGALRA